MFKGMTFCLCVCTQSIVVVRKRSRSRSSWKHFSHNAKKEEVSPSQVGCVAAGRAALCSVSAQLRAGAGHWLRTTRDVGGTPLKGLLETWVRTTFFFP